MEDMDAICLALTSHHFHSVVLTVREVPNLKAISPKMTTPGGRNFYNITYGTPKGNTTTTTLVTDFEKLMSRLWVWMSPQYKFCGRDGRNYVPRSSDRHDYTLFYCQCFRSEFYRCKEEVEKMPRERRLAPDGVEMKTALKKMNDALEASPEFTNRCREAGRY